MPISKPNRGRRSILVGLALAALAVGPWAGAAVKVTSERNPADSASDKFAFKTVPPPAKRGVARCEISLIAGRQDDNSGLRPIYLGKSRPPAGPDDPKSTFFFADDTDGGRLRIDLDDVTAIRAVNTYSWHPGGRGAQVYVLYGSDGTAPGFDPAPPKGVDPTTRGWVRVASVDTRPPDRKDNGGQFGVTVADDAGGPIGRFRHLLLDVSKTDPADHGANTFFSRIDVIPAAEPATRPAG